MVLLYSVRRRGGQGCRWKKRVEIRKGNSFSKALDFVQNP